jgi:hypothetical protein
MYVAFKEYSRIRKDPNNNSTTEDTPTKALINIGVLGIPPCLLPRIYPCFFFGSILQTPVVDPLVAFSRVLHAEVSGAVSPTRIPVL